VADTTGVLLNATLPGPGPSGSGQIGGGLPRGRPRRGRGRVRSCAPWWWARGRREDVRSGSSRVGGGRTIVADWARRRVVVRTSDRERAASGRKTPWSLARLARALGLSARPVRALGLSARVAPGWVGSASVRADGI